MHCGLKLHCLWALSRATVKTLLPRSNAVITRHWGLSHPLQIKPRTGNTQVIRGLLFCISVQCQSLAVGAKKKKNDFLCDGWGRVENKNGSQNDQPVFWWTVINAWQLRRGGVWGIHTVGLHVQAHILKLHPSLILSWVFESWFEQSKQK